MNKIKNPPDVAGGTSSDYHHRGTIRLSTKDSITHHVPLCQAKANSCEISQLLSHQLIQNRLAWLADRSGLPPAVIVEALIRAADPQLLRVAAALTPTAIVRRARRGGER